MTSLPSLPSSSLPSSSPLGRRPGPVARSLERLIGAYQGLVSPLLGPRCRFAPSCSHYAQESIHRFGAGYGSWLALRRLLRCHPFHAGGWDPVPELRPRHRFGHIRNRSTTTGATR